MMKIQKMKIWITVLLCVMVLIVTTGLGTVSIDPSDILSIFAQKIFGVNLPNSLSANVVSIFWTIRLPRTIAAFIVGSALAVTGTVMQSVLRNPLASSYTLGVSSGASLGVALMVIFGMTIPFLGRFSLPMVGFVFGLGTVLLAISMAMQLDKSLENQTIILIGMVLSLFVSSLLTILIVMSKEHLEQIIFWQMGSFSGIKWSHVFVLLMIVVPGILFLMYFAQELDIMTFGEEQAISVGIDMRRMKIVLITASALLTGTAVAFVGIIGFIDLIAPHVVRKIYGASHRVVVPMSALFGGAFMALADLVSRTIISPSELPIGAVTTLIGAPFFAYVYFNRRGVTKKNA
jgi:iron complex transport system permease protein